jgi:hypothetical protein
MTNDAPHGEIVDFDVSAPQVPARPVIKRTFHPETRASSSRSASETAVPVRDAGDRQPDTAVRVLNPAKVPSWRASSYDLMTGLTVRDVTDTIPGELFDEFFKPETPDDTGR